MKQVVLGSVYENYDDVKAKYERNLPRCFGVSFGSRHENGKVVPMSITFCVDEEKEPYIVERLEREKRCCTLLRTGDGLYTLYADVADPNEIMHWVKSFIGRVVSVEGGTRIIRERFYNDIERMNKMYGGDEDGE